MCKDVTQQLSPFKFQKSIVTFICYNDTITSVHHYLIGGRVLETKLKDTLAPVQLVGKSYATVCITLDPHEIPPGLLRKILSISADKLGSGKVSLASNLMIIANVEFKRRAGRIPPDVLLLKNPKVLESAPCWGGGV